MWDSLPESVLCRGCLLAGVCPSAFSPFESVNSQSRICLALWRGSFFFRLDHRSKAGSGLRPRAARQPFSRTPSHLLAGTWTSADATTPHGRKSLKLHEACIDVCLSHLIQCGSELHDALCVNHQARCHGIYCTFISCSGRMYLTRMEHNVCARSYKIMEATVQLVPYKLIDRAYGTA